MKVQLAHILQNLYRTTELDDVPVHRLQETLREHPYFSAGQFLLAQKLKLQQSEQYEEQVQKAAVYFHDPLWMHWQLNHGVEVPVNMEAAFVSAAENVETNGTAHAYSTDDEATFETVEEQQQEVEQPEEVPQPVSFVENIDEFQSPGTDTHTIHPDNLTGKSDMRGGETDNYAGESDTQSVYSDDTKTDWDESGRDEWSSAKESFHENGIESHGPSPEAIESSAEVTGPSIETNESSLDLSQPSETIESAIDLPQPPVETIESFEETTEPSLETTESSTEPIEPSSDVIRDESEERPVEETTPVIQMTEAPETLEAETTPRIQMTNTTETPHGEASTAPKAEKEPVAFDPYYTIDYFAYQGIKAPTEVQPDDKLGKQLKSFTEWLKTMRRLPQLPIEQQVEQPDEAAQRDIRRFADDSLKDKEVVTETMAEVLVKQDRKEEAIGIYEKLSLLDPSKSAYFAAKIENLKSELI